MIDPKYPNILIANSGAKSDSANHTTYFKLMQLILGQPHEDTMYLFFDEFTGLAQRHPDREIVSFTRDQFTPFLAYYALNVRCHLSNVVYNLRLPSTLSILNFKTIVRLNINFFFNSHRSDGTPKPWYDRDWLDPQTRALWARVTGKKRWMHYIGDLNLYLTIRYKDAFKPDHNQDENIHCHLIVSKLIQPTFITKWCWDYYFFKTKKPWRQKIWDFFDRNGTYYPEIPPVAIAALEKLLND